MANHYAQRTDSTQLPSAAELLDILTKESQRKAVRFDFIQKNSAIFDVHRQLSKLAGSDDSWIDNYRTITLNELDERIVKNHTELAQYIQHHPNERNLFKAFYNALVIQDQFKKSDAIFVFGSATNARVERAVELYNDGVADKIILSGNSPHYLMTHQSEASRIAEFAMERGVPKANLILEEASITLPDNVKRTIDLLETMQWQPASITIVATNFVLTRATIEWYKFCPWPIEVAAVAARPQSQNFTAAGWAHNDDSIALVLNEYAKIFMEARIDLMREEGELK